MASPWAALSYTAARALTLVRPNATLPAIIGGPGSLNWFAVIAALSGGGKGAAGSVARELVPSPIRTVNPGSGEGAIQAYAIRDEKGKITGHREAIMFDAAEIDSVTALANRSGATLMSVLRQGFSGETLGFGYADRSKAFTLDAHTYRMTLVIAVQPARAQSLFDGAGGGTPQRFMWFPGTDPRVTAETPWFPGPLTLPHPNEWRYPREIVIPAEAAELIKTERVKAMRGEQHALDGHALFVREKFAYALALLDGRIEMNSEDWRLSGIAAAVSARVRDWVAAEYAQAAEQEAAQLGTLRGITNQAADEEKTFRDSQRSARIAALVWRLLTEAGSDGVTESELRRGVTSRDRAYVVPVLHLLASQGLAEHDAKARRWRVRL